jgi:hypothetical protein
VTIEEHSVTFSKADLAGMLEGEAEGGLVDERDLAVGVMVGKDHIIGPNQLLEMVRSVDQEIPEGAEVVLAVRWRQEVEVTQAPPRNLAAEPLMPAGVAPTPDGYAAAPGNNASCRTCGSVPAIQGPTPDCNDALGCALVRAEKGEIGIARSVEPEGAPQIGVGGQGPGTRMLVNRETGEKIFADKNGGAYGRHDDYSAR